MLARTAVTAQGDQRQDGRWANERERLSWESLLGRKVRFVYLRGTRAGLARDTVVTEVTDKHIRTRDDASNDPLRTYTKALIQDLVLLDALPPADERPAAPETGRVPAAGPAPNGCFDGAGKLGVWGSFKTMVMGKQSPQVPAAASSASGSGGPDGPRAFSLDDDEGQATEMGVTVVATPRWLMKFEAVELLYNPLIEGQVAEFIRLSEERISACLYSLDNAVIVSGLVRRLKQATDGRPEVRLVMDKHQMLNPSCSRQLRQVLAVVEWGGSVRMRRPYGGSAAFMSAQHEKSWLFDDGMVVVGSANATDNSMNNCEEAVVCTRALKAADAAREHFGRLWGDSEPVTAVWLAAQIAAKEATRLAAQAVRAERSQERSQERSKSTSRARSVGGERP